MNETEQELIAIFNARALPLLTLTRLQMERDPTRFFDTDDTLGIDNEWQLKHYDAEDWKSDESQRAAFRRVTREFEELREAQRAEGESIAVAITAYIDSGVFDPVVTVFAEHDAFDLLHDLLGDLSDASGLTASGDGIELDDILPEDQEAGIIAVDSGHVEIGDCGEVQLSVPTAGGDGLYSVAQKLDVFGNAYLRIDLETLTTTDLPEAGRIYTKEMLREANEQENYDACRLAAAE